MFPQTNGLRELCFRGSNKYAELRIFALNYRSCVFVYVNRGKDLLIAWITFIRL